MNQDAVPRLRKASRVRGQTLNFRNATVDDADFILSLRSDPQKSRFLSNTPQDLRLQQTWLEDYVQRSDQAYFIIEDKAGERWGTVRLYDPLGDSFCWGSWIVRAGAAPAVAIESALMVYAYALHLGFASAHFDVRVGNESVWQFHERFGAVRSSETATDIFYKISNESIVNALRRYRKYMRSEIIVEY